MPLSWIEVVILCALTLVVGLLLMLLRDFNRLMCLIRYINFDLIEFRKLYEEGTYDAMAGPLSRKLAEKGLLLAWDTQRRLVALQARDEPLDPNDYTGIIQSLEEYRKAVGMFSEQVGSLVWYLHIDSRGQAPSPVQRVITGIQRDWREFEHQSRYLQAFLAHYSLIEERNA